MRVEAELVILRETKCEADDVRQDIFSPADAVGTFVFCAKENRRFRRRLRTPQDDIISAEVPAAAWALIGPASQVALTYRSRPTRRPDRQRRRWTHRKPPFPRDGFVAAQKRYCSMLSDYPVRSPAWSSMSRQLPAGISKTRQLQPSPSRASR